MEKFKGQLTVRGIVIGVAGCAIITAASAYTALKMGALPWPIVFAAIISLFFLRALGSKSLNEANVTHTVMSAGAMVAGGLVFTIPGIWMLDAGTVEWWQLLLVALAGVVLGLIATGVIRRHFIERDALEFPIGQAAAETLKAGSAGSRTGVKLFGSMGLAGLWTFLRDGVGAVPAMLFGDVAIPGVTFGFYMSPMMLSVGFLVGTASVCMMFAGACIADFGLVWGASTAGLWDVSFGQGVKSSLGMGAMMGCGVAVVLKDVLPGFVRTLREGSAAEGGSEGSPVRKLPAGLVALALAAVALVVCFALGTGPVPAVLVVLLTFVTAAMSAQSVGQTGIDPMEIFGLIVLLICAALCDVPQVQLFFIAAVVAVACGLAGDVMNDFKAGHLLGTSPSAQMAGQAIGAVVGAVVAVASLMALYGAYGASAFGGDGMFVAAQAQVVATMVTGIPCVPAFAIGLAIGVVAYCAKLPSMMLGLGFYLPFYMTFSLFVGCLLKVVLEAVAKARTKNMPEGQCQAAQENFQETGLVVASGFLGGESIIGVCLAFAALLG